MRKHITQLRKLYKTRYVFRLCVLVFTILMYFSYPQSFNILIGFNFFKNISWLHLLWFVWIVDMVIQLIPAKGYLPLGSLKQFKEFYKPMKKFPDKNELIKFIKKSGIDTFKISVVWILIIVGVGILRIFNIIGMRELLLISVGFYVLDMTFVLFWCPFRVLILKNRCCTTCRIFNWDHMMMFSPLLFIPGFYSISLFSLSIGILLVWEICFFNHPERFCEDINTALKCNNCNDKLCGIKNCKILD